MSDSGPKRRYSSPERNGNQKADLRKSFLALATRLKLPESNGIRLLHTPEDLSSLPFPTFDQLDRRSFFMKGVKLRGKVLADLREGDTILCKITHIGFSTMEIQPVCMLSRFRRVLSLPTQTIAYDKSIRIYKKNDYIKAIIITLNRKEESLNLKIEDSEAIKYEDLPFYYRQELENKPRKMDENDDVLTCLRNNNISELLSVSIDSSKHSFLPKFCDQDWISMENEAKEMRNKQNYEIAMAHVRRGTRLVKEKKYGDSIQCFTQALNVDDTCVEAYVGRGAACANDNNFKGALNDLREALRLEPEHSNAIRYKSDILAVYGSRLEVEGRFDEAKNCYEESIELSKRLPNHQSKAWVNLERLNRKLNKEIEVVTIADSETKEESMRKEQKRFSKEDRKKLEGIEKFIAELKKK